MTGGTLMTHISDSAGTLKFTTPGDFSQIQTQATGIQSASGITVDSNGNPWATGITSAGSYVFKGVPNGDVFSINAKLTEFGPNTFVAITTGIRAKDSNIWVVGQVRSARYDESDATVPSSGFGGTDGFIVRVSAADAVAHESTQFGGGGRDYVTSTFVDSKGDLWIGGQTDGIFGGKTGKGNFDLYATRFTIPSGSGKAQQTSESYLVGTEQFETGGFLTLDSAAHLWIAGGTEGQFPGGVPNAGSQDTFVLQVGK